MNKNIKKKQISVKNILKNVTQKKTHKPQDHETTPKSTKQSTPTSGTPTGKRKSTPKSFIQNTEKKLRKIDSSLESSLDASAILRETDLIKAQVLGSLETFKCASDEYIVKNLALQHEVDTFHEDFLCVKNEVSEILWESSKSKEELSKMRIIIESPKSRVVESEILDLDISSVKSQSGGMLYETLQNLQNEINEMRAIIEMNEKEVRDKDAENNELRSVAYRLRDCLNTETITLENEESRHACTGCYLF